MSDEVFLSDGKKEKECLTNISPLTADPKLSLGSNNSGNDVSSPNETAKSPPALAVLPDERSKDTAVNGSNIILEENKIEVEDDDTHLKQSADGTLLSRGGEFGAEEGTTSTDALADLQASSDIRFFICGTCKNNPILIGSTPKLLPCLHSFCEGCLQQRYEHQKKVDASSSPRLKCPSCGQEFLVAAADQPTSGFLNNQFVIESTTPNNGGSDETENHQCTSCDDKSIASSYCMNCNEWLCNACVSAHQRVKVTKDHVIQSKLSDDSSPQSDAHAIREKPLFCKVHPQEQLKLFCANCDKLTCRDCQLVEHKDHRYQFIDEAASKHREILKKLLQYLQINLGLLKETIVDVEKVSEGLARQEKDLEEQISKAFQVLIESIKSRQETLMKELKALVTTKQALLAKQKKDLTQMRVILDHNHDFAEFAVKGGSNVALLYSRKVLGTRLHNLNSLKYRQRPLAFTDLKFSMDVDKLCSYFNKIGATYSHEDMQRKIDHYNAKTPNANVPRTMVLTSRTYSKSGNQTPIESLTAINKRISESTAVTTSSGYINLSKQGTLGLPGHQTIHQQSVSPKSYNYNSHRHPSSSSQEMIVLSSSNPHSVSKTDPVSLMKKELASKYYHRSREQDINYQGMKMQTYDKNTPSHLNYQHAQPGHNSIRDRSMSTNSPHRENTQKWSHNSTGSKNNTIDQLRKMVEGTSSILSQTGAMKTDQTVNGRFLNDPNSSPMTRLNNGMISVVKEENKSPELPVQTKELTSNSQDDMRSESGYDEGQSNEDFCGVCRNGGQLLCCDSCPKVYHLNCHAPPLSDLPSDSWSCGLCVNIGTDARIGQKRRHSEYQLTEWELKLCEKLLLHLFVHSDSIPFHHKVSKVQVPDYYKVINKPMDLMTVSTKMSPQHFEHYRSVEDFINDIRLIFSNCFIYNSAESDVCKMGRRLEAHFDSLLKQYAPHVQAYPDKDPRPKRRYQDGTYPLV